MSKRARRIHINRGDFGIVMMILVMIAGMTFAMGFLLGYGKGRTYGVVKYLENQNRKVAGGEVEAVEMADPTLDIVEAYKKSKQQTLQELLSQQAHNKEPKSIADAKAYFDSMNEKDVDEKKMAKADAEVRNPASTAENASPAAVRVPAAVKNLFEPSVHDVQEFVPITDEWTIQIASYPTFEQAHARMMVLKEGKVHDAYVEKTKTPGGSEWHSILVGSYKDKGWTERVALRLKKRGLLEDYKIRKVP